MAFRKIEYLLILAFILLNVFLGYVFVEKNTLLFSEPIDQAKIDVQEEMRTNNIQFSPPEDKTKYLSLVGVIKSEVTTEDIEAVAKDQYEFEVSDTGRVVGELTEPIHLDGFYSTTQAYNVSDEMLKPLIAFMETAIYQGKQYEFSGYDEKQRVLTFMQTDSEGHRVVDGTGEIAFHLNDEYEVNMFDQTYCGQLEPQGNDRTIISEKQAMENLYLNNRIQKGDSIITGFLGYYQTLIVDDLSVYTPTWTFFIQNDDGVLERLHVDGINGTIVQTNNE